MLKFIVCLKQSLSTMHFMNDISVGDIIKQTFCILDPKLHHIFFLLANAFSDGRRVWTNNKNEEVVVYFTDRFIPGGEWVISNGSYILIGNKTNGATSDIPGEGLSLWDHYALGNFHQLTFEATLDIHCETTVFPSMVIFF